MQGRLQGKRLTARHFLDEVVEHGAEGCNYLLAVDVEMDTVEGYEMASWERGYGDFVMRPDLATLRLVPWQAATALCLADLAWARRRGRRRLAAADPRAASSRGWRSAAGAPTRAPSSSSSCSATATRRRGTRATASSSRPTSTTSTTRCSAPSRIEPLIRRIRNEMAGAGLAVENSKGECNLGQHEINFHYARRAADRRRALDLQERGQGDRRPGGDVDHASWRSSTSARATRATSTSRSRMPRGRCSRATVRCSSRSSPDSSRALRELTLLLAPNVNSYKRFALGSFAPTTVAWGR